MSKMRLRVIQFVIFQLFITSNYVCIAQMRGDIRVMFYNTENLFDTYNDSTSADDDFTPRGKQHWTAKRYNLKLNHIYQSIAAVGTWQPPEIIGLCEVENRQVLADLLYQTPLSKFRYSIVHFDSPDARGIDVGMLYRTDKAKVIKQQPIRIEFADNPQKKTRDILFVQLQFVNGDTICFFVNHWPSRRGGELESESLRIAAATVLRHSIDSLFAINAMTKIIIMGDFNDDPDNESLAKVMKANYDASLPQENQLYNLSYNLLRTSKIGTHCFQGQWAVIDQIIVSGDLLLSNTGYCTTQNSAHICSEKFLLQTDKRNVGFKTYPTYSGPQYIGGYSDHLPIFLDLFLKK